jgi:hypothetical protein
VKPCKNRHVCGEWSDRTAFGTFGVVVNVRKDLSVRLVVQDRAKYPAGKASRPACCVYERAIVRVVGEVISVRDAKVVAEEIAVLKRHIEPARRVR